MAWSERLERRSSVLETLALTKEDTVRNVVAIAAVLLVAASVASASTGTYSGRASNVNPFAVSFTTDTPGLVSASATWRPKTQTRYIYVFTLKHLTDPADGDSFDQICQVYDDPWGEPSPQTRGHYSCWFDVGASGYWVAEFRSLYDKVAVTLEIIH